MTVQSPTEIEKLVTRYGEAWNSHDLDAIMNFHTDDTSFHLYFDRERASGKPAVRKAFAELLAEWPDMRFDRERLLIGEDFFSHETTFTATIGGKRVSFPMVDVMTLRDGRVVTKDSFGDLASLMRQTGAAGDEGRQRIAVYGASGYTGAQVVAEIRRRGHTPVLVGRNRERLETVGGDLEMHVAALDDAQALRAAFAGCVAVINCAGPFAVSAESVAAAAIDAGAHYVDFAAEQEATLGLLERWGPAAADAGVALVPSMGFYGGLGDLLASVTARGLTDIGKVTVAYAVDGWRMTPGSRETVAYVASRRRAWRDGRLELATGEPQVGRFDYGGDRGEVDVFEDYALPDAFTVPRHIETPDVRVVMTMSTLKEIFGPDASAQDDADELRNQTRFTIVAEADGAEGRRRTVATGTDIYGISAPLVVDAALRLGASERVGGLAPGEAFDAEDFLASVAWDDLAIEMPALHEAAA